MARETFREDVERLVEQEIRPIILSHGGDIKVRSVEDGKVTVVLTGACQSCPAAQITTEEVVESKLREHLGDELVSVHLYGEVDPDVWSFAKKLLNNEID